MKTIKVNKKITENHTCNHCCHNEEIHVCPRCHFKGIEVPSKTVLHLSQNESLEKNDIYYICTNPKCNCVYFSKNTILDKQDISTKVWFKSSFEDFKVCYCHDIMLTDIIKAVAELGGCKDKSIILKHLGKDISDKKCDLLNPVGKDCDKLFLNAIEYANQVLEKEK